MALLKLKEIPEMTATAMADRLRSISLQARSTPNGELSALQAEISKYETQYGVDSATMLAEVTGGSRAETTEVSRWLFLVQLRTRLGIP